MIVEYNEDKYIPFISREKERDFLKREILNASTKKLFISGNSGTGKTTLARKIVDELYEDQGGKMSYIYFDAYESLTSDINISNFQYLFALNLFAMIDSNSGSSSNSFYSKYSFKDHLQQSDISLAVIGNLIRNAVSFIPNIGALIQKVIPEFDVKDSIHLPQDFNLLSIVSDYIRKLSDKSMTILVIDNYQFLNDIVCQFIRQLTQNSSAKMTFIQIIRTENDDIVKHNCSGVTLERFTYNETVLLLKRVYGQVSEDVLGPIYENSSNGNLKDLEMFIRENNNLDTTTDTANQLESELFENLKKDIGLLSVIFNNGIHVADAIKVVRKISYWDCSEELIMDILSHNPYINFNSELGVITKAHERIANKLLESSDDEKLLELLVITKQFLDDEVSTVNETDSDRFIYLINLILTIKSADEIVSNANYIGQYIRIQYDAHLYENVISIYKRILTLDDKYSDVVIESLPIYCISILLNAFEKTSSFKEGYDFCEKFVVGTKYQLYRGKFLLHSYKYDEAMPILSSSDDLEYKKMYLNLLQHQREDKKVRAIIEQLITEQDLYKDEIDYYLILRNSAHVFEFNTAKNNLIQCARYFDSNPYYKSMVLNNLGIVYLKEGEIVKARALFEQSKKEFVRLSSVEEYQPTFNMGLCFLVEQKYQAAIDLMNEAIDIMPSNLTFDRIKFYSTIYVCKYLGSLEDSKTVLKKFSGLVRASKNNPDPWLGYSTTINYAEISKSINDMNSNFIIEQAHRDYPGDQGIYGYIYHQKKNQFKHEFILATSPHWRC